MIQGMVDGLAERLISEGGTAEEWARLISSQSTLGNRDAAQAALTQAEQRSAMMPPRWPRFAPPLWRPA